jgi:3-oxoacyl-[acyl-carrier protein] reductase
MTKEKVIVITGAASGIGMHLAKVFYEKNFSIVVTDINIKKLALIFSDTDRRLVVEHDISIPSSWESMVEKTIKAFGTIDYLFNVAAIIEPNFVNSYDLSSIDKHFDINTKGTIYGIKIIGDIMIKKRSGHIINVASLAGLAPIYGIALYSASKYAVRGYSLAVAQELRKHNVYCTVICPDLVDTPMLDQQLEFDDETALTFSGNGKPLKVKDIETAFIRAMLKKPLEICVPTSRGITAKIANFFPEITFYLTNKLVAKGRERKSIIQKERR